MDYIVSRHGGALLVAVEAADERTVSRALKQIDRDLVLTWDVDERTGRQVWKVHKLVSRDRPAIFVCSWRDELGMPLPLSSALVEEVKRLREVDTMAEIHAHNAAIRAEASRDTLTEAEAIAEDMLPRIRGKKLPVLHRGPHLRRSRAKKAERKQGRA